MACISMPYIVIACIVMACIVMAYIVIAHEYLGSIGPVDSKAAQSTERMLLHGDIGTTALAPILNPQFSTCCPPQQLAPSRNSCQSPNRTKSALGINRQQVYGIVAVCSKALSARHGSSPMRRLFCLSTASDSSVPAACLCTRVKPSKTISVKNKTHATSPAFRLSSGDPHSSCLPMHVYEPAHNSMVNDVFRAARQRLRHRTNEAGLYNCMHEDVVGSISHRFVLMGYVSCRIVGAGL